MSEAHAPTTNAPAPTSGGPASALLLRAPRVLPRIGLVTALAAGALHAAQWAERWPVATAILAAPCLFLWSYGLASRFLGARAGALALACSAPSFTVVHAALASFLALHLATAGALVLLAVVGASVRPRDRAASTELRGDGPDPFGRTAHDALLGPIVLAVAVALPWLGAGPIVASYGPDAPDAPDAVARSIEPSTGSLPAPLLERFVETSAAARTFGDAPVLGADPWLAGAAFDGAAVAATLRASWGTVLALGPFALGGVEAGLCLLLVGLGAASFGLGSARGLAWGAVFFAPSVPGLFDADAGASLVRWGSGEARILASAFAFVAACAWLRGASSGSWRVAAAVPLAVAFAIDAWIGGVAIAALTLASLFGPRAIDRLLPVLAAAIPGLLVSTPDWPDRSVAAGGFVGLGAVIVACVLVLVVRRTAGDRARLALATLIVGAVAASWAGGVDANAALFLLASIAVAAAWGTDTVAAYAVVLAGAMAGLPDLVDAVDARADRSLFVDAGPHRVAVRVDPEEVVDAAWAGAPPPTVFDPSWVEPVGVSDPHAHDWAALWANLATDRDLRALDPVLLVLPRAVAPRYAGGVRTDLAVDGARVHEGVLLSGLDAWLAHTGIAADRAVLPPVDDRLETLEALLDDDALVGPVHRRRLDASPRPFVVPVGPEQRDRVRALERRLLELGGTELWRRGEVALFGLPRAAFAAIGDER